MMMTLVRTAVVLLQLVATTAALTPPRVFRAGVWQGPSQPGDVKANLEALKGIASLAAAQSVELLVLPELFLQGYGTASAVLPGCALRRDAAELKTVGELARHHNLCICLPYAEKKSAASASGGGDDGDDSSPGLFNSVSIFDPADGQVAHHYQKVHLAGKAERALFARGAPDGLKPCSIRFASGAQVQLGVSVCYDLEFPEPARCLAVQGAEVLIAPTAVDDFASTPRFIPARAMENQLFVLHANPEGRAPPSLPYDVFSGGSAIYGPDGHAIVKAGEYTGGTLLTATIHIDDDHAAGRSEYLSERALLSEGGYFDSLRHVQQQAEHSVHAVTTESAPQKAPAARGFASAPPPDSKKKAKRR